MALPGTPWLTPGDVVTVAISGLGVIENTIYSDEVARPASYNALPRG